MSEETWLAEFYPVPANEVSAEDALDHSIKKWEGALRENLEKHGLDEPPIDFDSDACPLCVHYIEDGCTRCPLYIARGDVDCCTETRSDEKLSPLDHYGEGNPRPMLYWLKKAKEMK